MGKRLSLGYHPSAGFDPVMCHFDYISLLLPFSTGVTLDSESTRMLRLYCVNTETIDIMIYVMLYCDTVHLKVSHIIATLPDNIMFLRF